MSSEEKLNLDIVVHYIYRRELSIQELKMYHKILPGFVEVVYNKPTPTEEGSMIVIDLQSNNPHHEYGTHLMMKAAEGAKTRGIENITLDDFSDRYRVDHNIYIKLGLTYEDHDGGPEMVGLVDDVLNYNTNTEPPKVWTLVI
jgi:hypothetical protein